MKNLNVLIALLFIAASAQAQNMGNWMLGNSLYSNGIPLTISETQIGTPLNWNNSNFSVSVKGMYNITPDAYVAVFSLSQEGEDEAEVNRLINQRITAIDSTLKLFKRDINVQIDIISYVPIYETILQQKVFSKNTYVEKPRGFELKKNIHIQYFDSKDLNKIFSVCSKNEVYDFVRVDLISKKMDKVKEQLREKSDSLVFKQLKRYSRLMDISMDKYKRSLNESFKVVYPAEKYISYIAFSGTSYFKKKYDITHSTKKNTKHYMPVIDKEFDFVINPVISEPVIQVMYHINIGLTEKPEPPKETKIVKPEKEFFIITPEGVIKKLP